MYQGPGWDKKLQEVRVAPANTMWEKGGSQGLGLGRQADPPDTVSHTEDYTYRQGGPTEMKQRDSVRCEFYKY